MKGIVLAGGLGTRLLPMTRVTNKHLLPVYDRPMIYYPLQQLAAAGIEDILVVTGGDHAGDFLKLLRNGEDFGLGHLRYAYQDGEGGIAEALGLAEQFANGEPIVVILGDNIFLVEKPPKPDGNLAVTGCYMYDARVFDVIRRLAPSDRNELEITDVNNQYIEWGAVRHAELTGWWTDAGTVTSLHRAAGLVADDRDNTVLAGSGRPASSVRS